MNQIDSIQIISERHSGSKWFTHFLKNSLGKGIQVCDLEKHWFVDEYILKHFLETSLSPVIRMIQHTKDRNIDFDNFNDLTTDNKLIIIITRYTYDWIKSMKKYPYHCRNKEEIINNMTLSEFIRSKWNNPRDETFLVENVVDLRTKKYKNWFKFIPEFCDNVEIIQYESLLLDIRSILNFLKKKYDLSIVLPYHYDNIQGQQQINQSIYFNPSLRDKYFNQDDIEFIESYMNLSMEKELGY